MLIVVDGASPRIWNPADEPVPVLVPSTVGAPSICASARNMLWMAQNQPSWAEMGLAGHHHVREHYDIRKSVEKLESVYSDALAFH